jgi:hypothetical protein
MLPHSEFAAAFRLHVTPRLRDMVIARGIESVPVWLRGWWDEPAWALTGRR